MKFDRYEAPFGRCLGGLCIRQANHFGSRTRIAFAQVTVTISTTLTLLIKNGKF